MELKAEMSAESDIVALHKLIKSNNNNNNNNNNSIIYYLCAESTVTRPITDTAQCRYR
jgi:hypothetical protein